MSKHNEAVQLGAYYFARFLKQVPAWKHITIRLISPQEEGEDLDEWKPQYFAYLFRSFRYIRNRTHIEFQGITGEGVKAIADAMMSATPIIDLDLMLEAAQRYMYQIAPYTADNVFKVSNSPSDAGVNSILAGVSQELLCLMEATKHDNTEKFFEARKRMLRGLAQFVLAGQAKAYACDPQDRERDLQLQVVAQPDN